MLIYQAPSERFIDDVRENTISDIMSENYKARLGKDPRKTRSLYHGRTVFRG
ncbi:MAG: hypothetical protein IPN68_13965 [Bacteroidetes bacterium]|nr:hypothetical protein [Bacteroidota bacterium]